MPAPSSFDVANDCLLARFFFPPRWLFLFFFGIVWGPEAVSGLSIAFESVSLEGVCSAVGPGRCGCSFSSVGGAMTRGVKGDDIVVEVCLSPSLVAKGVFAGQWQWSRLNAKRQALDLQRHL
jgi:hypothetical protein